MGLDIGSTSEQLTQAVMEGVAFALRDNLEAMSNRWGELTQAVRIVQGMQDKLVYPGNIDFLERTLPARQLHATRLEAGHLLHLEQRPRLLSELRTLIAP